MIARRHRQRVAPQPRRGSTLAIWLPAVLFFTVLALIGSVVLDLYTLRQTRVTFEALQVDGMSLSEVHFTAIIRAANPTPFAASLSRQHIEVYTDRALLATIERTDTTAIPGHSSIYLQYPVTVKAFSGLKFFLNEYIGQQPVTVRLQGFYAFKLRCGYEIQIPVNQEAMYTPAP